MLRVLKVTGDSLEPDYRSGDYVVVARIPAALRRLRPGDVVAFRHPAYGLMIKRIVRLEAENSALYVVGTHPNSVDSRSFGPVAVESVIGKVVWRIARP